MSNTLLTYTLTEYSNFRELQFEYSKLKDQNTDLKIKLETVECMYRQSVFEFERKKNQWHQAESKLKDQSHINRQKLSNLIHHISNTFNEISQFQKMGIDFGLSEAGKQAGRRQVTDIQNCKGKIDKLIAGMMLIMNKNNDSTLKYEKQIQKYKSQNRLIKKQEKELKEQITYLSEEINKLQNINSNLLNELSSLKRQNMDFKLKIYEFNKQQQQQIQESKEQVLQDNNFAMDLLHYEKELLQRIFTKILATIKNETINQTLTDIYASYQTVSEVYREKLQIEYDLQDLQRQYKLEKHNKISQHLLIQLRKQIQQFRNQLHRQKELLSKEEKVLEQNFINLQVAEKQDKKIRTYTVEIEKKLKDIKSYNDTKRHSQESSQPAASRIKFKPTHNTEDLMKEMVKKDRQNIDKIFKQTRRGQYQSINL